MARHSSAIPDAKRICVAPTCLFRLQYRHSCRRVVLLFKRVLRAYPLSDVSHFPTTCWTRDLDWSIDPYDDRWPGVLTRSRCSRASTLLAFTNDSNGAVARSVIYVLVAKWSQLYGRASTVSQLHALSTCCRLFDRSFQSNNGATLHKYTGRADVWLIPW